jgi:hypothetical protein
MQKYTQDTVGYLSYNVPYRTSYANTHHEKKVTTGRVMNMAELSNVQGRPWDDIDVSLKYSIVFEPSKSDEYTALIAIRASWLRESRGGAQELN